MSRNVNEYFDKVNLKLEDIIAVSVDWVPAMLDRVIGFLAFARERNPKIEVNHHQTFGTWIGGCYAWYYPDCKFN